MPIEGTSTALARILVQAGVKVDAALILAKGPLPGAQVLAASFASPVPNVAAYLSLLRGRKSGPRHGEVRRRTRRRENTGWCKFGLCANRENQSKKKKSHKARLWPTPWPIASAQHGCQWMLWERAEERSFGVCAVPVRIYWTSAGSLSRRIVSASRATRSTTSFAAGMS